MGSDSLLREALQLPLPPHHTEVYHRNLAEIEAQMGAEAFERAWTRGRQMSLEQCIDYGLACR